MMFGSGGRRVLVWIWAGQRSCLLNLSLLTPSALSALAASRPACICLVIRGLIGLKRSCCTGGEISYAFSSHGSLSILFEQGRSFQPSYEDTMAELETENWPGILGFWRLPTPAYGHVSTPCNSRCRLISFSMCTAFRIDFPDRTEGGWVS